MDAFISYSFKDRQEADQINKCLRTININGFMAHEHIQTSRKWADEIMKAISQTHIFISLWSKNYIESSWCLQESGIAAHRYFNDEIALISLSIDRETMPKGALSSYQAKKINCSDISPQELLPEIISKHTDYGIALLIGASNFKSAELYLEALYPALLKFSSKELAGFLNGISENDQVIQADKCIHEFIPRLFEKCKEALDESTKKRLADVIQQYSR